MFNRPEYIRQQHSVRGIELVEFSRDGQYMIEKGLEHLVHVRGASYEGVREIQELRDLYQAHYLSEEYSLELFADEYEYCEGIWNKGASKQWLPHKGTVEQALETIKQSTSFCALLAHLSSP